MLRILLLLLALWLALVVVGWVVEGLFWLAVAGLLLLAGTALVSSTRRR
ncbi:LPXTG cell wall anchor domain-containing protein [Modestobacter sp. I12A-02662]